MIFNEETIRMERLKGHQRGESLVDGDPGRGRKEWND